MFIYSKEDAASKLHKERTDLLEVEAMRDVVSGHEGSQQMGDGTSLTTVRPECEGVHPPLSEEQKINMYYATERQHILRGTFCPVKSAFTVSLYRGEDKEIQGRNHGNEHKMAGNSINTE